MTVEQEGGGGNEWVLKSEKNRGTLYMYMWRQHNETPTTYCLKREEWKYNAGDNHIRGTYMEYHNEFLSCY
jgi:hypothetical protein